MFLNFKKQKIVYLVFFALDCVKILIMEKRKKIYYTQYNTAEHMK